MFLNISKKEKEIIWTSHSKVKMRYYGFSDKRVLKILRKPDRVEEGIAPKTIATMQVTGTKKNPTEAWMMYSMRNSKIFIISAWRYPGRTPEGQHPVVPQDALEELNKFFTSGKKFNSNE